MNLKCLIDHTYQETHFEAGKVYELEDGLALEFLRDFGAGEVTGQGSVETRRGRPAKFEVTTERPTDPVKPEEPVDEIDNTLPPEGGGEDVDLESMTRAQLEAFAQERDLEAPKTGTVNELRDFLRAQLAQRYEAQAPAEEEPK